jgi:hypothetical protein
MKSPHRLLDSYPDSLLDEPGAQPAIEAIPITGLQTILSQDVRIMHLIQSPPVILLGRTSFPFLDRSPFVRLSDPFL